MSPRPSSPAQPAKKRGRVRHFVHKHKRKIIAGHGIAAIVLVASGTLSTSTKAILYFTPHTEETFIVGETRDIDINLNAKTPVNALGTTITFPEDVLEVVGINKKDSFLDLWTEDTVIKEDVGEVHFSGGTLRPGGLVGTGTALTLTVKAKKAGEAELHFQDVEIFAHDGKGLVVNNEKRSLVYTIVDEKPESTPSSTTSTAEPSAQHTSSQNPDLNDDGKVTLVDVSIMTVKMVMPYDTRYDLNIDGKLGLADLSILLAKMF